MKTSRAFLLMLAAFLTCGLAQAKTHPVDPPAFSPTRFEYGEPMGDVSFDPMAGWFSLNENDSDTRTAVVSLNLDGEALLTGITLEVNRAQGVLAVYVYRLGNKTPVAYLQVMQGTGRFVSEWHGQVSLQAGARYVAEVEWTNGGTAGDLKIFRASVETSGAIETRRSRR